MRSPLVSVCIPTRDRAPLLRAALHSVFAQTLQDFEVIVSDDASSDDTEQVVAQWDDPRLMFRRNPRAIGVASNRNACLELARGRFVAWLDSDDLYHPHMLETQCAALDRHPDAALAHGAFDVIDASGRRLPDWPRPFADDTVERGVEAFRELVLRNYVGAPTVVVRRRAHEAVGPYWASLRSAEDWEMWLRLALHGDLAYTTTVVAQYRWHPTSLSRSAEASGARFARELRVISGVFARNRPRIRHAERLESRARAALSARALRHANDCMTRRLRRETLASLLTAVRARPALCRSGTTWRLLSAAARGEEYAWHRASKRLLARLAEELDGSRMAATLHKVADPAPEWEETLGQIARTVREVVPRGSALAFVDKWDPTLRHLSNRRGWHYPDRRSMPDGYPPDSGTAVAHLEELRCRGARYLVFPCSGFWWLEHYPGLVRHLELSGERVWEDERCVIYRLLSPEPVRLLSSKELESTCEAGSS